jgi:probable rRNA maturation factor
MKLDVAIDRSSALWADLPEAEALAERVIDASVAACRIKLRDGAEVGLKLVDDAEIASLNARWRGLAKPTNVLSFPAAPFDRLTLTPLLGDIVVAYETTKREAEEEGKSLADHFAHLVAHGFLHLVGYDHEDPVEADRMEALEIAILRVLAIADPYAETELSEKTP